VHFSDQVSEQDCSTEGRDVDAAIRVHGGHLPFHQLLLRCQQANFRFLYQLGGFDVGLNTPHVEADLLRGVAVGRMDMDVTVETIGRTSFTLRCEVAQDGQRAAIVRMVLVSFDYERERPVPLSSSQVAALKPHSPTS
jgi:acyl-CoA thioesterase FadM